MGLLLGVLTTLVPVVGLVACGGSGGSATGPTSEPSRSAKSPSVIPVHPGTIAFARLWANEGSDICLIQTDGTGYTQLTDVGKDEACSSPTSWSPDGAKIAYEHGRTISDLPNVWVMGADGTKERRLTRGELGGLFAAFSPDGKRIAYVSYFYPPDEYPPAHIYVMNADGSKPRQVTRGEANDMFPAWSPDGKILFLRKPLGRSWYSPDGDVWAVRPNGSGLARVTKLEHVGGFALSPGGSTLAVHDTGKHRIVLLPMGGDGAPVTLVDEDFGMDLVQPAWSPDGAAIALAHSDLMTPDSPYDAASLGLWVVNADGSGLTAVPNAEGVFSLTWRPE